MQPLPCAVRFAVLSASESDIAGMVAPPRSPLLDTCNICCCGLIENPALLSTIGIHEFQLTSDVLVRVLEQEHACIILVRSFAMLVESRSVCLTCQSGRHRSAAVAAVLADWSSRLLGPTLLRQSFAMHSDGALAAALGTCADFVTTAGHCQDSGDSRTVLLNGRVTELHPTSSISEMMLKQISTNPWAYFAEIDAIPIADRPRGIDLLPDFRLDTSRARLASTWQQCCHIAASTAGSFRHMALQAGLPHQSTAACCQSWPAPAHQPPRPPAPPRPKALGPSTTHHPLPTPLQAPLHRQHMPNARPPSPSRHRSRSHSKHVVPQLRPRQPHWPVRSRTRDRRRRHSADQIAHSDEARCGNVSGALLAKHLPDADTDEVLRLLRGRYQSYTDDLSHMSRDRIEAAFCSDHAADIMTLGLVPQCLQESFMVCLGQAPAGSDRHDDLVWLIRRQWGSLTGDKRHIESPSSWFRAAFAKFKTSS